MHNSHTGRGEDQVLSGLETRFIDGHVSGPRSTSKEDWDQWRDSINFSRRVHRRFSISRDEKAVTSCLLTIQMFRAYRRRIAGLYGWLLNQIAIPDLGFHAHINASLDRFACRKRFFTYCLFARKLGARDSPTLTIMSPSVCYLSSDPCTHSTAVEEESWPRTLFISLQPYLWFGSLL